MNEMNQGMILPFDLPSALLRRRAGEYRRRGQLLEALSLMRRAALKDDSAYGWYQLGMELRHLGCWEAAAAVLGRALSRKDCPGAAWGEMGRCQAALENRELAVDCLCRQLQEEPWSPESDAARLLLAELETPEGRKDARRTQLLTRRGMEAWQRGDRELAMKRLRRACRIASHPEKLLNSMALLCMMAQDWSGAVAHLHRALRKKPDDPRSLTTMAAVLQEMGRPLAARGFLRRAMPLCDTCRLEDQLISSAWAIDAWTELDMFLNQRLKHTPHRTALLRAKAIMCAEQNRRDEAKTLLRTILEIDPDDREAAVLLDWMQRSPEMSLFAAGRLPLPVLLGQREQLRTADTSRQDLLQPGSDLQRLLMWCASSRDAGERRLAMDVLKAQPDRQGEISLLRELLARPDRPPEACTEMIVRLTELGCGGEMLMVLGGRYTFMETRRAEDSPVRRPWRMFLPLLLAETACHGRSREMVDYAAALWRNMNREQRLDAATTGSYLWCKSMEIMWLCSVECEAQAARVMRQTPVSRRRIRRMMRRIFLLGGAADAPGEAHDNRLGPEKEIQDEVHQL